MVGALIPFAQRAAELAARYGPRARNFANPFEMLLDLMIRNEPTKPGGADVIPFHTPQPDNPIGPPTPEGLGEHKRIRENLKREKTQADKDLLSPPKEQAFRSKPELVTQGNEQELLSMQDLANANIELGPSDAVLGFDNRVAQPILDKGSKQELGVIRTDTQNGTVQMMINVERRDGEVVSWVLFPGTKERAFELLKKLKRGKAPNAFSIDSALHIGDL